MSRIILALATLTCISAVASAAKLDVSWIENIRPDHPRIYFNADQWPEIQKRALGAEKAHYERVKNYAESPTPKPYWTGMEVPPPREGSSTDTADWGNILMAAAFVYRVEPSPERLDKIREMLWASIDYYNHSYELGKCVNWYSTSRIGWIAALDWVWNDLQPQERDELGTAMLAHLDECLHKPDITRRNRSGYTTGYYGVRTLNIFLGILLHNEGIDDERALEALETGWREYHALLQHRSRSAADDGGGASATLAYLLGHYPHAEWNLFYTWEAATGEDLAAQWPYMGLLPNYVLWNRLPGNLEYGYGDCKHMDNKMPTWRLDSHMSNAMNLYAPSHPDYAALAGAMRQMFKKDSYSVGTFSVYPFLWTDIESAPEPAEIGTLPPARHFENMGQVFMRSSGGDDDTYCMFACGGISAQHRHYDATHFTIYKKGFLALDTGTRRGNTDNLQNYYAQTVAHNCILIKMPGEAPSPYWNGEVYGQAGGQNKQVGSEVIAFETYPEYTYVAGDATPQYNEEKCSEMIRQFVFIPPDHFVVFDRVTSTEADYTKRWLLHHANEPTFDGKTWYSDQDEGRIFCRTLLPEDAVLTPVGGPGKEFIADGLNYPIDEGPSAPRVEEGRARKIEYEQTPELMGRWRVEVSPGQARQMDRFLHLIQVGDQSLQAMSDASVTVENDTATVTFDTGVRHVTVSFAQSGDIRGHITISEDGEPVIDRDLITEVTPQSGLATMD